MPRRFKPYLLMLGLLVATPLALAFGVWLWLLSQPAPFTYAFAQQEPWPVACSTRGCVTTQDWARQFAVAEKFSRLTASGAQTPAQALTTAIRQHLLHHAFFKSPVTQAEASRYRQQVLNVNKGQFLQDSLGLTPSEYDRYVVLPFLEQEALRAQNKVESTQELYSSLSRQRFILFLPWQYRWDRQKGEVTTL